MDLKSIPVDVALGLLGIPITPDIQSVLDNAKKYLPEDTEPAKILVAILGMQLIKGIKDSVGRTITALEGTAKALKDISFEMELLREGQTHVIAAVGELNVTLGNHRQ